MRSSRIREANCLSFVFRKAQDCGKAAGTDIQKDQTYRSERKTISPVITAVVSNRQRRRDGKENHGNESEEGGRSAYAELDWPPAIILAETASRLGGQGQVGHASHVVDDTDNEREGQ